MKKYIITIMISLVVGFFLANFMLKQYDGIVLPTFGSSNKTVYLVQQGVYSTEESMKSNTSAVSYYDYNIIDNMYYVYIGMSLDEQIIDKLQAFYNDLGVKTIVKTITTTDSDFIKTLEQYDNVLRETDDSETIKEVCKQVLSKYKGGN